MSTPPFAYVVLSAMSYAVLETDINYFASRGYKVICYQLASNKDMTAGMELSVIMERDNRAPA